MKIKSLSFLLGLVCCLPLVQAQSVGAVRVHNNARIWMDSNTGIDETVYYQCDALESKAKALLKKMNATNISVTCFGNGDPEHVSYSPSLTLKFDSLRVQNGNLDGAPLMAQWSPTQLRGSSDCETMRQLFNGVKNYFEVMDLTGVKTCFRNDESFQYTFQTLNAQGME